HEIACVRRLATVGLGDGLHMLGPLPPREEGGASDCAVVGRDHLELSGGTLEGPNLIGLVEALAGQSWHRASSHCRSAGPCRSAVVCATPVPRPSGSA